jgi:hypothetical protein
MEITFDSIIGILGLLLGGGAGGFFTWRWQREQFLYALHCPFVLSLVFYLCHDAFA